MRTAIVDDILRRLEGRTPTPDEQRQREERRRDIARLVTEISSLPPGERRHGVGTERRVG